MARAVLVLALVSLAAAGPMKMYEKSDTHKYQQVLVPVSSTVIPLDDLPVFKVSAGFGVASQHTHIKYKPDGPVKLITIHSLKNKTKTKKDPNAAFIEEVTPEEYRTLTQQQQ
ncbi:uncharacterized protein [Cherax quadricarinatus]